MTTFIQELATLDRDVRDRYIDSLSEQELEALAHDWQYWARPEQITPDGDWNIWLVLAGRGWGKTRTLAEDFKVYGMANPRSRMAIVAPTYADARDTCVEGESGLLRSLAEKDIRAWNRSLGELVLANGTRYKLFSSDEPERLRGPQHHRAWCEELCAWKYPQETWDNLMFGLRLGFNPQAVISTTPKRIKLLLDLVQRVGEGLILTRGNTFENAANLAPAALAELKRRYWGTRTGIQELYAQILDDIEGALWKRKWIDDGRVVRYPDLKRIVVAVDPPASSKETNKTAEGPAECGIVVVGLGTDEHGYVLADYSLVGTPDEWASEVLAAYNKHKGDLIVAEVNNGGEMVGATIKTAAKMANMGHIPFEAIHASRGKQIRAEPVSTLYKNLNVHHVGVLADLEFQQCNWVPGEKSPDRLDAAVWGVTKLMLPEGKGGGVTALVIKDDDAPASNWQEFMEQQIEW